MEFEKEMPETKDLIFVGEKQNREILHIKPCGDIIVNGKLIGNDKDVINALRQVLEPEINKNKAYDKMLEFIKKYYRFLNIDDQEKAEELIKEATTI